MSGQTVVLLVEGEGDREAVPVLLRMIAQSVGAPELQIAPNPITGLNVPRLQRQGELERFMQYGLSRLCNGVLIILDCEDDCVVDISRQFFQRIEALKSKKKVGICLFYKEYETLFLHCLDHIREKYDYGWNLEAWCAENDFEKIRNAKGSLSKLMKSGKSYKETRDQAKFTTCLDLTRLNEKCRSFRHLEKTIRWIADPDDRNHLIYPNF